MYIIHSEFFLKCISERQILRLGSRDWISGRVAATRYQKLMGGMPPVSPALTEALKKTKIQSRRQSEVRKNYLEFTEVVNIWSVSIWNYWEKNLPFCIKSLTLLIIFSFKVSISSFSDSFSIFKMLSSCSAFAICKIRSSNSWNLQSYANFSY